MYKNHNKFNKIPITTHTAMLFTKKKNSNANIHNPIIPNTNIFNQTNRTDKPIEIPPIYPIFARPPSRKGRVPRDHPSRAPRTFVHQTENVSKHSKAFSAPGMRHSHAHPPTILLCRHSCWAASTATRTTNSSRARSAAGPGCVVLTFPFYTVLPQIYCWNLTVVWSWSGVPVARVKSRFLSKNSCRRSKAVKCARCTIQRCKTFLLIFFCVCVDSIRFRNSKYR